MLKLKVLSYNIHKGFSSTNLKWILREIRQSIRKTGADLVLLQEVLGQHDTHGKRIEEWPNEGQFEFLADQVWTHYAYGKNAIYPEGHHGNAILSKFPILRYENINISTNKLEQRGLLHAVLQDPASGLEFDVGCVHLDLFEKGRRTQLNHICERILQYSHQNSPLILGGDFNDWARNASPLLNQRLGTHEAFLSATGQYARTFPSWLPFLKLDRLYLRGFQTVHCEVLRNNPWSALSDHAPLLAEIELTGSR